MDKKGLVVFGKMFLMVVVIGLFFVLLNFSNSDSVTVTATVGNASPSVGGMAVCSTDCSGAKTIAPGTAFTIGVGAIDPNGNSDINWDATEIEIYTAGDTNADVESWDHIILSLPAGTLSYADTNADGCSAEIAPNPDVDVNCFAIEAGDWTVKFLEGAAKVWIKIYDKSAIPASGEFEVDYNAEANEGLIVSGTTGISVDTTTGTFSGSADSTDNAFTSNTTNNYIAVTHNGNQNLELKIDPDDLNSGEDIIGDSNISWYLSDDAGSSTPFSAGVVDDTIHSAWARGTSPTASVDDVYTWLDIPAGTPSGDYSGSYAISSEASS